MTYFAFDLDGTLFDTYNAVYQSYVDAGVIPPADFWGRPWREWLHDPKQHDLKNKFFKMRLKLVQPLPLLQVLEQNKRRSFILTAASQEAALAVCDRFRVRVPIFTGLSAVEKAQQLRKIHSTGIYFDDNADNCRIINQDTLWRTVCVSQF